MITGQWKKSSRSSAQGNCVEVKRLGNAILIQESEFPDVVVTTDIEKWQAFIEGVKAGEFDL